MTLVVSKSVFPVQAVVHRFYYGNRYHCVSVKVTLAWDDTGRLAALVRQPAWILDDVWCGAIDRSSVIYPSDLIPFKPMTDVLVVGTAHPPDGEASHWDAALVIAGREKRLRLFGPRCWRHSLISGWTLSNPERCSAVALLYENAYGGAVAAKEEHFDEGNYYAPNPVGRGFMGKQRRDTNTDYAAAQIETWTSPLHTFGHDVDVGGFGPLPGFVPERQRYAGTWDARWQSESKPAIPLDMDMRYWNTAPADQLPARYLQPGDTIDLVGLRIGKPLHLTLPPVDAWAVSHWDDHRAASVQLNLDTVLIDLDQRHLTLRYHRIVAMDGRIDRINVSCAVIAPMAGG